MTQSWSWSGISPPFPYTVLLTYTHTLFWILWLSTLWKTSLEFFSCPKMLRPRLIKVGDLMCLIGVCTPSAQQSRFSKTVFWMNKWTKERRNILLLHHFVRHSHPPWDFNTKFIIYFPHHLLLTTSMTTAPMRCFQPLISMCLDFYGDKWMIPTSFLHPYFPLPQCFIGCHQNN